MGRKRLILENFLCTNFWAKHYLDTFQSIFWTHWHLMPSKLQPSKFSVVLEEFYIRCTATLIKSSFIFRKTFYVFRLWDSSKYPFRVNAEKPRLSCFIRCVGERWKEGRGLLESCRCRVKEPQASSCLTTNVLHSVNANLHLKFPPLVLFISSPLGCGYQKWFIDSSANLRWKIC